MASGEGQIELPPDSTGSRVRTLTVLDQDSTGAMVLKHMQVVVHADGKGDLLDFTDMTKLLGQILDELTQMRQHLERMDF